MKTARLTALLTALRGRKMLIIGNNDDEATTSAAGWEGVSHYAEIEIDRKRVVLCHYAFRSWNGMRKGSWNLHGHSHGALAPMPRQADAGVDVWNFRPIGFDEIGRKKSR